mgnify:CR=1 FL=1
MLSFSLRSRALEGSDSHTWRNWLRDARQTLKNRYVDSGNVLALLRNHCALVDQLLVRIWQTIDWGGKPALLAVGGYGRGELYPYSDVDLLILIKPGTQISLSAQIEQLIGLLWDAGLEVGHSVRTSDESIALAHQDVSVQTNLLESRFLTGNASLAQHFLVDFKKALDRRAFFLTKEKEQAQRHLRYHDSAFNLEPNVKESPGGLRDLQTILWITRAALIGHTWQALYKAGLITAGETRMLRDHERTLQNLRARLHYLAGRREDRLLFDYQANLAETYGYDAASPHEKSERIMQRYYRSAKVVSVLNEIVLQNLRTEIFPRAETEPRLLNQNFQIRHGLLELRHENVFSEDPHAVFKCFLTLQTHEQVHGLSAATLRALWRANRVINKDFRNDPVNRRLFMALFRAPQGLTHTLRHMNQYGLLGRYIPAFGRIVGKMQHDLFHVYTVDEHILFVVRNLRRFTLAEFQHEYPLCSRLIGTFERPEVLYIAALFHDIAKGRGGDHSALGAVDVLRFCRDHEVLSEDTELISWLVKNHLTMSSVAQKKDLSDPYVIGEFTEMVANHRRLDALYLLTVADIRGTSPKVWNAWKGKLLEDLYHASKKRLSDGVDARGAEARKLEARHILQHYLLEPSSYLAWWAELEEDYFWRHEAHEIAWHTRNIRGNPTPSRPIVKARLARHGDGVQVMIYAPDREDLFARICAAFERTHYNIVEAKIYTTRNNHALDTFVIMDYANIKVHYRDLLSYIEYEVLQMLAQSGPPPSARPSRLSRHLKHFPIEPKVTIEPDTQAARYVLSVVAGDMPGLLLRIAHVLLAHHIQFYSAKITTLGERAEDTFVIKGPTEMLDAKQIDMLKMELQEKLKA